MTTTYTSEISKLQQFVHDIRSPLLSLEIFAKRAAPQLEPEQRRLIDTIVERLRSMADEVLGIESSATSLAVHSASAIVDRVVDAKWLELDGRHGVTLECRFGATAREARIAANALALERVLSNLINNSFEAIETAGRVTLSLSATATRLLILIEDTGCGFDEHTLSSLRALARGQFGPAPRSTKHSRVPLGLTHAIQEVRAFGGHIRFDNNSGNGAAVSIVLPLAR